MTTVEERLAILESSDRYQNEKLVKIDGKLDKTLSKMDGFEKELTRNTNLTEQKNIETKTVKKTLQTVAFVALMLAALMTGRFWDLVGGIMK